MSMPALSQEDLYLLSAMMQSIAALWGVVFVVYVLLNELYMRRDEGFGWQGSLLVEKIENQLKALPAAIQSQKRGTKTTPSWTTQTRRLYEAIPEVRKGVRMYGRTFRMILWSTVPVLLSIGLDLAILRLGDSTYLNAATAFFLLALLWIGFVLAVEVRKSYWHSRVSDRLLETSDSKARKAYEETKETIPDDGKR